MWEVVAHPEGFADLLSWVCEVAVVELQGDLSLIDVQVYTSPEQRIVVITKWRANPRLLSDPPRHTVRAGPFFADFSPVDL